MRGIDSAAFGVDSDNNSSKTKNATKMFIPEANSCKQYAFIDFRVICVILLCKVLKQLMNSE